MFSHVCWFVCLLLCMYVEKILKNLRIDFHETWCVYTEHGPSGTNRLDFGKRPDPGLERPIQDNFLFIFPTRRDRAS